MVNLKIGNFDQEYVKSILNYDPETGIFVWKENGRSRRRAGRMAGHRGKGNGYVLLGIKAGTYSAHRIAWLYVYGVWPSGVIDHINGIPDDNRISNLRNVSQRDNSENLECHRNGKIPGLRKKGDNCGWTATISQDRKTYVIGTYKTIEEAIEKREEVKAYGDVHGFFKKRRFIDGIMAIRRRDYWKSKP